MKKKIKIKWKNIIALILIIVFINLAIVSSFSIFRWSLDSSNTEKQIEKIQETTKIEETPDSNNVKIIEQKEEIPAFNPYWDYIKMNFISVNFEELKLKNNNVKGWIKVNGTNINYPFVQFTDNDYYLTHSFDKSYNSAGWVFLDYRNSIDNLNKNTIIYAHGRYDETMFGSLKNILNTNWHKDTNNYIIKLATEKESTLWQVFSVYRIPTTSDYLEIDFNSEKSYQMFLDLIQGRSSHNFNTTVNTSDNIITLSTCYNKTDKVVMHAKLIKKESVA